MSKNFTSSCQTSAAPSAGSRERTQGSTVACGLCLLVFVFCCCLLFSVGYFGLFNIGCLRFRIFSIILHSRDRWEEQAQQKCRTTTAVAVCAARYTAIAVKRIFPSPRSNPVPLNDAYPGSRGFLITRREAPSTTNERKQSDDHRHQRFSFYFRRPWIRKPLGSG